MTVDVSHVPFFTGLSDASRDQVLAAASVEQLPKSHPVFRSGQDATEAFILLSGKVKLTRPSLQQPPPLPPIKGRVTVKELRRRAQAQQVRESLLWLMGPGEMFGELSIFDGGARSTAATTQTEASVLRFPGATLRHLVESNPEVSAAMLRQLATRLRRSDNQSAGFILSDVPGRLAHLLLSLGERFGEPTTKGLSVPHDLTQAEIAQIVGASRESVNKALSEFENRGLITVNSRSVVLHDQDKLQARTA